MENDQFRDCVNKMADAYRILGAKERESFSGGLAEDERAQARNEFGVLQGRFVERVAVDMLSLNGTEVSIYGRTLRLAVGDNDDKYIEILEAVMVEMNRIHREAIQQDTDMPVEADPDSSQPDQSI